MGSQERQESKPWDAEGISRATWYRRHRETIKGCPSLTSPQPETEAAPETPAAPETKTADETDIASHTSQMSAPGEIVETASETVTAQGPTIERVEEPGRPWIISEADAARPAERYRTARKEKGEMIATRALRWELQDAGVQYQQLQREVDRIRQLAGA